MIFLQGVTTCLILIDSVSPWVCSSVYSLFNLPNGEYLTVIEKIQQVDLFSIPYIYEETLPFLFYSFIILYMYNATNFCHRYWTSKLKSKTRRVDLKK